VSELRSVLDQLKTVDPILLSPDQQSAGLAELIHGQQQIEVILASWIRSIASSGGHHEMGYSSPTAMLSELGRMSPARAKRLVSYGNAQTRSPLAHQAWADGRLSTDQATHLFRAAEAVPDEYPQAEERLVDIVEPLDAVDTGRAVEYWRQAMDGPGELDPEKQLLRRGLSLSKSIGGMRRVDGWLTDLAGQALETALEANMPPPRDGDTRTPRQRRHDALENLCRDWLDNGTTPTVGGEKPQVIIHTDLAALQGLAGGLHETEDGQILPVDLVRAIACDSSVTRIVFGSDSEILDVGRRTRVWSPAQRRAIIARDRHCQGPGCRAKPRHCDIHHEDHWADGGSTTVDKGKLFCRPCHIQEHAKDGKRRSRRRRT
jgi:hypothetical protein